MVAALGSALKEVSTLNSEGTIKPEDYKQIATNIMTLPSQFHSISQKTQSETTQNFLTCLQYQNLETHWNETYDAFMDYSLAGVDIELVKEELTKPSST